MLNTILCGDSKQILKTISDEYIDSIICSPPYLGQRKYNAGEGEIGREKSPQDYISNLKYIFTECKRVLKLSGNIFVVIGDSHDRKNNSLYGIPERFAIMMQDELNFIRRQTIIWYKRNAYTNSSESKKRFHTDFEYIYHFVKTPKIKDYYFNMLYRPLAESTLKEIKEHYNGKARKSNYKESNAADPSDTKRSIIKKFAPFGGSKHKNDTKGLYSGNEYNPNIDKGGLMRCVWDITHQSSFIEHYAIYPKPLVKRLIECSTPENGIVLDPFCGSGQTCVVAQELAKNYIGIELNKEFVEIAKKRLSCIPV